MFKRSDHKELNGIDLNKDFPIRPDDYGDQGIEAALVRLYGVAIAHADWRINWYDKKANSARVMSRLLRSSSLTFFALGTIAPIASNILSSIAEFALGSLGSGSELPKAVERISVSDVGYIFLAVAGGLVIFDQFFEYSASWTRFRQSQARLERLRADLRYTWAVRMAEAMHPKRTVICQPTPPADTAAVAATPATTPAPAQAQAPGTGGTGSAKPEMGGCAVVQLIQILRDFVNAIELLAETETREWAERYRARIQAFDDHALSAGGRPTPPLGASKDTTHPKTPPASVGPTPNVV